MSPVIPISGMDASLARFRDAPAGFPAWLDSMDDGTAGDQEPARLPRGDGTRRSSRESTSTVDLDEVHAVMGPNGSGKSTLAYALMGHPAYEITEGEILFDGENLVELGADERAQRGLFLAFQYPHAVPGVTVTNFLRSSINSVRKARAGQGRPDPDPRVPQGAAREDGGAEGHPRAGEPLHQRRLLGRRAQEDGDAAARDAEAAPRRARRDRHRPRHRRAQGGRQCRQHARRAGDGRARDHPLPACAPVHQAQLRPRLRRRQDRRRGRPRACAAARGGGLQGLHPRPGGGASA